MEQNIKEIINNLRVFVEHVNDCDTILIKQAIGDTEDAETNPPWEELDELVKRLSSPPEGGMKDACPAKEKSTNFYEVLSNALSSISDEMKNSKSSIDSSTSTEQVMKFALLSLILMKISANIMKKHSNSNKEETGNVSLNNQHQAETQSDVVQTQPLYKATVADAGVPAAGNIFKQLQNALKVDETPFNHNSGSPAAMTQTKKEANDKDHIFDNIPLSVQQIYHNWVGDANWFSRQVLQSARITPFSLSYVAGDPGATRREREGGKQENLRAMFALKWHKTIGKLSITCNEETPNYLNPLHVAYLLNIAISRARKNSDFIAQPYKYPHIVKGIEMLGCYQDI